MPPAATTRPPTAQDITDSSYAEFDRLLDPLHPHPPSSSSSSSSPLVVHTTPQDITDSSYAEFDRLLDPSTQTPPLSASDTSLLHQPQQQTHHRTHAPTPTSPPKTTTSSADDYAAFDHLLAKAGGRGLPLKQQRRFADSRPNTVPDPMGEPISNPSDNPSTPLDSTRVTDSTAVLRNPPSRPLHKPVVTHQKPLDLSARTTDQFVPQADGMEGYQIMDELFGSPIKPHQRQSRTRQPASASTPSHTSESAASSVVLMPKPSRPGVNTHISVSAPYQESMLATPQFPQAPPPDLLPKPVVPQSTLPSPRSPSEGLRASKEQAAPIDCTALGNELEQSTSAMSWTPDDVKAGYAELRTLLGSVDAVGSEASQLKSSHPSLKAAQLSERDKVDLLSNPVRTVTPGAEVADVSLAPGGGITHRREVDEDILEVQLTPKPTRLVSLDTFAAAEQPLLELTTERDQPTYVRRAVESHSTRPVMSAKPKRPSGSAKDPVLGSSSDLSKTRLLEETLSPMVQPRTITQPRPSRVPFRLPRTNRVPPLLLKTPRLLTEPNNYQR